MPYSFRFIFLLGGLVLLVALHPSPLWAQVQERTVRSSGTVANVFETLDPEQALDGIRVRIPDAWRFEELRLLRYGTEPIPIQGHRTDDRGTHLFTVERPIKGPHDLLLRVLLLEAPGTYEWTVESLVREDTSADSRRPPRLRTVDRRGLQLHVEAPPPTDRTNEALSLEGAAAPLYLDADALPTIGRASFTIEFWFQTNGLDEIILSTWNGNESVAYPAEFLIDRSGRLRFYSGQPGRHRALRTGRPVADGKWHHVAVVHDARHTRLRLLLDGTAVDSLQRYTSPPAPGPVSLAIGGRLRAADRLELDSTSLFSGHLDELRIWEEARSTREVRRLMRRPLRSENERREQRVVRLGFDGEDPPAVDRWPEGADRVPVSLSFESSLRNLRAQSTDRDVTLQWAAEASDVRHFVIERSSEGASFTKVAEVRPDDVRQSSAANVPEYRYTDEDVSGQVLFYRIRLRRTDGIERTSGTIKIGRGAEDEEAPVTLIGNFPNPFSETTTIAYEVKETQPVTITVWNLAGHEITRLTDRTVEAGYHERSFDATDLPSGTYFVRLKSETDTQSHRMVVLK